MKRREVIALVLGAVRLRGQSLLRAQTDYPSRSITPPAGITDLSARLVAEGLHRTFNQPVIVENKSGGNGTIGLRELVRAAPDGYTLMVGTVGTMVITYAIDAGAGEQIMIGNPPAPFDPARDIVPIAGMAEYATAMVVNKQMPVNSVQEFIAYARSRPGEN